MAEYITIPAGFKISTTLPVDSRLIMTRAEMLAVKKPQMPNYYFVLCSDDKKIYIYDKSNSTIDPEFGLFRPIEDYLTFTSPEAKEKLEAAIKNSAEINRISDTLGDAQERTGVFAEIDDAEEKINAVSGSVDALQEKVETELEPKVETLDINIKDLEPQVAQAQEDITVIQTWINNVKLDGGEIKALYNLHSTLTHITGQSSNPTTIEYMKSAILNFVSESTYSLPRTVTVNGIIVGSATTDCNSCKAQWINGTTGTLVLEEATGDISFVIEGVK